MEIKKSPKRRFFGKINLLNQSILDKVFKGEFINMGTVPGERGVRSQTG